MTGMTGMTASRHRRESRKHVRPPRVVDGVYLQMDISHSLHLTAPLPTFSRGLYRCLQQHELCAVNTELPCACAA